MKRVAAVLLATMMVFSLAACSSDSSSSEESEEEAELDEEIEFDTEPEYEPNAEYDKYTCIEYDISGQAVPVTVCANSDETEFELICSLYGDDQDWVGTYENGEATMESDLTGFMDEDAAGIIEEAINQGKWKDI